MKLSDLPNGIHSTDRTAPDTPYTWKFPPNSKFLLVVAPVEIGLKCSNFTHPNLLAKISRVFEYKHSNDSGRKWYTSKPGVELYFAIPYNQIELIPDLGYSYVKVRINGMEYTLDVAGGGGGSIPGWEDWIRQGCHMCGTGKFTQKLLEALANVAISPEKVLEVAEDDKDFAYALNFRAMTENERQIFNSLLIQAERPTLLRGNSIKLNDGCSFAGETTLTFLHREMGKRATQNIICRSSNGAQVSVKMSQVNWAVSADLNQWQIPKFDDSINVPQLASGS